MPGTVIVALPAEGEKVYRVSSEKIPHLTMMYLGEVSDLDAADVVTFVDHAATYLDPFYLTVDHRGKLGPDEADVVFFEDNFWEMPKLKTFRHQLLLNKTIRRLYDAADQFPDWTPHLTLGYPQAPAHEIDNDLHSGIHGVQFDRLAVWFGNFEGPEIRLNYTVLDGMGVDVAMSDTLALGAQATDNVLAHFGKKGMKWGVRNDKGHEGEAVKTKKLGKLDKKWEKENAGQKGFIKAHNAMADRMNNGEIDKFNSDPRWKDVDLNKNSDLEKTYMNEYFSLSNKIFNEELVKLGTNPSGTKSYQMVDDGEGNLYAQLMSTSSAAHAEGDKSEVLKLNRDAKGHITSVTPTELVLKHYGVKGMRWGVTTVDKSSSVTKLAEQKSRFGTPKDVTVTQNRAGTYVKTSGGTRQKATEEAIKAAAGRQKAKRSTTDSLTNDELRASIERMNLEQQFVKLAKKTERRSKVDQFINTILGLGLTLGTADSKK